MLHEWRGLVKSAETFGEHVDDHREAPHPCRRAANAHARWSRGGGGGGGHGSLTSTRLDTNQLSTRRLLSISQTRDTRTVAGRVKVQLTR